MSAKPKEATKKVTRTSQKKAKLLAGKSLRIRMYNVGFGDSFLLTMPLQGGDRRILFDCGSIAQNGRSITQVAEQIIKDSKDDRNGPPRIDVVVATHRHRDHVSGFAQAAWRQVEVKEVWLPWTEDPDDADARRIQRTQSGLALHLERQFAMRDMSALADGLPVRTMLDITANAKSNDAAMKTLHSGFAGSPLRRFLPVKGTDPTFTTDALPGMTIHVLGPSREEKVIRDMDPPAGRGYLAMLAAAAKQGGTSTALPRLFGLNCGSRHLPRAVHHLEDSLPAKDRQNIIDIGSESEAALAVALDKAVNGTSLMLVLEIGKARLLFPGDAQWGTWNAVLSNPKWVKLLKQTTFLKVGHHGSHNATPKAFVEQTVPKGIEAMVSTRTMPNWPNIPKAALMTALKSKAAGIARSDQLGKLPAEFTAVGRDAADLIVKF